MLTYRPRFPCCPNPLISIPRMVWFTPGVCKTIKWPPMELPGEEDASNVMRLDSRATSTEKSSAPDIGFTMGLVREILPSVAILLVETTWWSVFQSMRRQQKLSSLGNWVCPAIMHCWIHQHLLHGTIHLYILY